jgi:hypothetical protein
MQSAIRALIVPGEQAQPPIRIFDGYHSDLDN